MMKTIYVMWNEKDGKDQWFPFRYGWHEETDALGRTRRFLYLCYTGEWCIGTAIELAEPEVRWKFRHIYDADHEEFLSKQFDWKLAFAFEKAAERLFGYCVVPEIFEWDLSDVDIDSIKTLPEDL